MYNEHFFRFLRYVSPHQGVQRKSAYPIADNSNLLSKKSELASFVKNILQEIKSPVIKDHVAVDDRSFSVTIIYTIHLHSKSLSFIFYS